MVQFVENACRIVKPQDIKWIWHDEDFASLMLGRIELAQISKSRTGIDWFYTLFFTKTGERPSYSCGDASMAQWYCESHADKVIHEYD